jgi:hypothetical protein
MVGESEKFEMPDFGADEMVKYPEVSNRPGIAKQNLSFVSIFEIDSNVILLLSTSPPR